MTVLVSLEAARAGGGGVALGGASFAEINTSLTNDFGPDGMTWAQAWPVCTDAFGKLIMACQNDTGSGIQYLYSNDGGATWADNTGTTGNGSVGSIETFITRSALAYAPVGDWLWALHVTTNGGDGGAFLRRYSVTRDGSNNITAIDRDYTASCVLEDDANASCRQPILLYESGAQQLVALWAIADADTGEIHGSCRVLENNADDLTAANWLRLAGSTGDDASTIASTKSANISVLTPDYASHLTPAACLIRNGANAGDLALFWQPALTTEKVYYRRFVHGSESWASPTTPLEVASTVRAGSTTIRQLYEVLSKPVEDGDGNLYVAYASWKDDTDGDTWAVAKVDTDDALAGTVDVYSAGGAFDPALYALTGDICYDADTGLLVVTHVTSGGVGSNDGVAQLVTTALALQGGALTFFDASAGGNEDVDIPLIYQDHGTGETRLNGDLLVLFRDTRNQTPPYHGWAGALTLA